MGRTGPIAAVTAALLVALAGGIARADKVAAAEALFQEGRRLMKAGKLEKACPKLEESQRLDPGTGTLWHLARCYAGTDRLASAWARYHELAALARSRGEKAKVKAALAAAEEVEPRLHKLVLAVPEESRLEGLEVTLDDVSVGPGAFGTEVPVDRGIHRIRAVAPGREPWQTEIEIAGPAAVATVKVPALPRPGDDPAAPVVPAPDPEPEPEPPPPPRPSPPRDAGPWYRDPIAWTLTASGVVLLAGGGGALWRVDRMVADAEAQIDLDERDRRLDAAERYQLAGGALLLVGGGVLAAGAIKLALHDSAESGPEQKASQASIAIRPRGILFGLSGDF